MKMFMFRGLVSLLWIFLVPWAQADDSEMTCQSIVASLNSNRNILQPSLCEKALHLNGCSSVNANKIWHFQVEANPKAVARSGGGRKILVFALVHGDEPMSAQVAASWVQRLSEIDNRNSWRVIPFMNPDGLALKTRNNANGVDLNRNYPTRDWKDLAEKYWKEKTGSDPRRFPGKTAGSEPETQCSISHIKDYKPDLIVSVHTPYELIDFDGPNVAGPSYKDLPWRRLGNFPGSLGRYMWKDHQIPVVTVELGKKWLEPDKMQDAIGAFAVQLLKQHPPKNEKIFELL